ncbi:MAG TPA: ABC transporter permease [Rubrobacter sp.]
MNPSMAAVGAGIRRGGIELRQTLTNVQDMWNYVFLPTVFLVVMYFLRGHKVPGTDFSLGAMSIPSVIGMQVAFGGLVILATVLIIEREDGTLLRAKATSNGMLGYLVGKVLTVSGMSLVSLAIVLVPGAFLFEGMRLDSLASWSTLAWVLLLGLVATIPMGAVIGSLLPGPRSLGFVMVPTMGLVATSGIFYPITGFPVWLQWIAQVFPIYWLGLGMRSALLPASMAAAEIGGSWRHLETIGVLGLWAVAGLILAPIVLRRMARRESGSSVAGRREKAMQRNPF